MRRCSVRAMYLSASAVAVSTKGRYNKCSTFTFTFFYYYCAEEFNNMLLTPELSKSQLLELHKQMCDLYRMYINPASADCIRLDDDIITQLKTSRFLVIVFTVTTSARLISSLCSLLYLLRDTEIMQVCWLVCSFLVRYTHR